MTTDDRLTVFQFVHHFPTHTTVWEVWETDYSDISQVSRGMSAGMADNFLAGADGKVYMVSHPMMMSRHGAMEYVRKADDYYTAYQVIEIN